MNWQIGDRAVILYSIFSERVGLHVTIMSESVRAVKDWDFGEPCHAVSLTSISCPDEYAYYAPRHLGPIPDEYDGKQVITWDECPYFQPRELVTV